ncbi:hypothetical protein Fcan01_16481 [Folsomia candida]|uniref:Uncharacterized protein n=1 Tax=Folsomia candida TaxID=158441 RepID=A0A226DV60_FOLCA|nr:hypothetical protein Fcan01_16481 [Folsomia candida]
MEKSLMTTPTGGVVSKFQIFNLDLPIELRRMICRMPYMSWVFAEAPMATPLCRHEVYDKITAGYDDLTIRQESVPRSFEFPCRILKFNTAMSFDFFDLVTSITASTKQRDKYKLLENLTFVMAFVFLTAFTVWAIILYKIQEKDAFIFSLVSNSYKWMYFIFFLTFEAWSKTAVLFHVVWDQYFLMAMLLIHSYWLRWRVISNISTNQTQRSSARDYSHFRLLCKYMNAAHVGISTPFILAVLFLYLLVGSLGAYQFKLAVKYRLQVRQLVKMRMSKEDKIGRIAAKSLQLFGLELTEQNFVQSSYLLSYYLSLSTYVVSAFSPMLIEPDPFVSLLNSRQKFYFENIHANLLNPPANLVARWKLISKFNNISSDILRMTAPSALVGLPRVTGRVPVTRIPAQF